MFQYSTSPALGSASDTFLFHQSCIRTLVAALTLFLSQFGRASAAQLLNETSRVGFNIMPVTLRALQDAKDSIVTARVAAASAAAPICLSMMSHIFLGCGERTRNWLVIQCSLVTLAIGKALFIPIGMALLVAGLVIGDLEVSVVGVATLAFVYAAQIGSWGGVQRLQVLMRWMPNMIDMERWHTDGTGAASSFRKEDPYNRGWKAFRRLLVRASDESSESLLSWEEEVVLSILATKFVTLTTAELGYIGPTKSGPRANKSIAQLANGTIQKWESGWRGKPGKWAREWTSFDVEGASPEYESTLRFVVVLFELIMRSSLTLAKDQRDTFAAVLNEPRDLAGSMAWVAPLMDSCM